MHAKRLAPTGCVAGDALVKRYAKPRWNRFAEVRGKNDFELRGLFVPQHHAKEVVVHDLLDAVGNAAEEFIAIENGSDFLADLGKQREALTHCGVGSLTAVGMPLGGGYGSGLPANLGFLLHRNGSEFTLYIPRTGARPDKVHGQKNSIAIR
jgi:hypothetical protein